MTTAVEQRSLADITTPLVMVQEQTSDADLSEAAELGFGQPRDERGRWRVASGTFRREGLWRSVALMVRAGRLAVEVSTAQSTQWACHFAFASLNPRASSG